MIYRILSFLIVCTGLTLYGNEAFIAHPPKGWECINDTSQLPQKVKLIYVGPGTGKTPFTPSLNVACETTSTPIKEYVAQAKGYHESQERTQCKLLGQIQTDAGPAELLQIDRPTQWGDVRFVQAMLISGNQAYVITATCLKPEFSNYSSQIFKAIQSFNIKLYTK